MLHWYLLIHIGRKCSEWGWWAQAHPDTYEHPRRGFDVLTTPISFINIRSLASISAEANYWVRWFNQWFPLLYPYRMLSLVFQLIKGHLLTVISFPLSHRYTQAVTWPCIALELQTGSWQGCWDWHCPSFCLYATVMFLLPVADYTYKKKSCEGLDCFSP